MLAVYSRIVKEMLGSVIFTSTSFHENHCGVCDCVCVCVLQVVAGTKGEKGDRVSMKDEI